MKCPFCGGDARKIEESHSSVPGGWWRWALCCEVNYDLIENYELLTKLPPEMMKAALRADQQEREMRSAMIEANAIAFKEWKEECERRWPDLHKGTEQKIVPFDIVALTDKAC